MNGRKLYRSRSNRMITGVCGGIGEFFNIDPTLVRLGVVLLSLFTLGTAVVGYLIASVVVPNSP